MKNSSKFLFIILFLQSFILIAQENRILLPQKVYRQIGNERELIEDIFYDKNKLARIDYYHNGRIVYSSLFEYEKDRIIKIKYVDNSIIEYIDIDYKDDLITQTIVFSSVDSNIITYRYINKKEVIKNTYNTYNKSNFTRKLRLENSNKILETANNGRTIIKDSYDNSNSPYKNVSGYNEVLTEIGINFWTNFKNNVVESISKTDGEIDYKISNKYYYNTEGYPIKIEYSMRQGCEVCKPNTYIYDIEYVEYQDQEN